MLTIDILTIFPNMFSPVLNESILKIAQTKKKIKICVHDLRAYTKDKHKKVDDRPFGGGPGMVMSPQPLFDAIQKIKKRNGTVVLLSPAGKPFDQCQAKIFSQEKQIVLICGRYEGIDNRIIKKLVDQEISIGDYVLTGGELPAMVLVDAITRLIPGVLGKEESLIHESFENNRLDFPQYTRPANFRGMKVPNVLLSGNHKKIKKWRLTESLKKTQKNRRDLLNIK
jgi:tRNA (guanine37-N1)-methyltransferase